MAKNNTKTNFLKKVYNFLVLLISMAGYVPKNATILRTIAMIASFAYALYLSNYQPNNSNLAIAYFLISEAFYISFIMMVLPKNGFRLWFIRKWGNENDGYLAFETILGFLFFHNGVSIGYISSSSPDSLFNFINKDILLMFVALLFITGFTIKIFAAKVVTIEIYYWKDMFLGKKISDFVIKGPYKFLKNPMYGIGQLPAYAFAIWYGSKYGIMAAFLNQFLIFSFYYLVENKFIKRVYQKPIPKPVSG
jgi:protein-S-isoprenylcysteine O-methyltransferase Ste14